MPDTPLPTLRVADRLLRAAADARALVVGDVMLDRYLTGTVSRISPEAPVPVLRARGFRQAPGGAANVAAGVRSLGAACRVVGVVGEDRASSSLRGALEACGVEVAGLVADPSRPTTVKTRVLARHQQMLRIDRERGDAVDASVAGRLLERSLEALEWATVLVIEDYDKGALVPTLVERLLQEARRRGVASVVDPKLRHFFRYRGATVFKPNDRELAAALGREAPPEGAEALGAVAGRLECDHLLVTLGERGMVLLEAAEGRLHRIPSRAREVYDVSGAGDTVTAVMAATVGGAASMVEAAALANFAAGLEVSRLGARPVTRDELLDALAPRGEAEEGEDTGPRREEET